MWTLPQRRIIVFLVLAIVCYLCIEFRLRPVSVGDPQPSRGSRYDDLQDRLDPNVAEAPALATLPSLGEKRAKEIVTYREAFFRAHPGDAAFKSAGDLLRIKGIGVSTVANVEKFLIFPQKAATTKSSL